MEIIFEGQIYLEKFPGKGGWTFARIPKEYNPKGKYFGMVEVFGSIDEFSFEKKHLVPTGDGTVFIPISNDIRKAIQKEAGDPVFLKIYRKEAPDGIPDELLACLKDDPGKLEAFLNLPDSEQKEWVQTVYSSSNEDLRVKQILRLLNSLA